MFRLLFWLFAFLLVFLVFKGVIKNLFFIYLIIINVFAMFMMYWDKRKAQLGLRRVPEKRLFLFAILGGSPFMLASMFLFRHKILKPHFLIGIPLIFILQVMVLGKIFFR